MLAGQMTLIAGGGGAIGEPEQPAIKIIAPARAAPARLP
jgi:hypothetical protein